MGNHIGRSFNVTESRVGGVLPTVLCRPVPVLHMGHYLHVRALRWWIRLLRWHDFSFRLGRHPARANGRVLDQRLKHGRQHCILVR